MARKGEPTVSIPIHTLIDTLENLGRSAFIATNDILQTENHRYVCRRHATFGTPLNPPCNSSTSG